MFFRKIWFVITIIFVMLGAVPALAVVDIPLEVSCGERSPKNPRMRRLIGDGDTWVFKLVDKTPLQIKVVADGPETSRRPKWDWTGKGANNPGGGIWNDADGTKELSWLSPEESGLYIITATYRASGCGTGGEDVEYTAAWEVEVIECEIEINNTPETHRSA